MFLFGKLLYFFEGFGPAGNGCVHSSEQEAAFSGCGGHVVAQVGFVCHFAGVVDEVLRCFAEPPRFAVLDKPLPASSVIDDEYAAAGHGFEADARPVFMRVCGLQDDAAVPVEILLAERTVVSDGSYPWKWFADFLFAAFVEAEEDGSFRPGGDEVFVDVQGEAGEFVGVLAGDAAAAEYVVGAFFDVGEVVVVEVGSEGVEDGLAVRVEPPQNGHVLLAYIFILVEEHGDFVVEHGFLFAREEPGHAVDEDGSVRLFFDVREALEEGGIAESEDGVTRRNVAPVIRCMDADSPGEHFPVHGVVGRDAAGGDEMDFHSHVEPEDDLMVEFRSGSTVESGESVDVEFFER